MMVALCFTFVVKDDYNQSRPLCAPIVTSCIVNSKSKSISLSLYFKWYGCWFDDRLWGEVKVKETPSYAEFEGCPLYFIISICDKSPLLCGLKRLLVGKTLYEHMDLYILQFIYLFILFIYTAICILKRYFQAVWHYILGIYSPWQSISLKRKLWVENSWMLYYY